MVNDNVSKGGDSGGPWWYGDNAVGVHSGRWWDPPHIGLFSTFTPVTDYNLKDHMGIEIYDKFVD